ncbi:hypothetical protein WME99_32385 [Sorangium sp. So ce136]|uniref:hypothetical protein n=1 Tax=Sorangium sp. So ce136 TaxID=3133284 RepID=UPI003F07AE8A
MGQNVATNLVKEPLAVRARLDRLGLVEATMDDARRAWSAGEASASPFEPPTAPGTKGWFATVGFLRETLSLVGWDAVNVRNCPLIVAPSKQWAICVTSGDRWTGSTRHDVCPSTKNPKGCVIAKAVQMNWEQMGLDFGPRYSPAAQLKPRRATSAPLTWLFMIYTTPDDVYAELSLPAASEGGYIVAWHERIVLPALPRQNPPGGIERPEPDLGGGSSEIDVPVLRR